jgi:chaperonin GroES
MTVIVKSARHPRLVDGKHPWADRAEIGTHLSRVPILKTAALAPLVQATENVVLQRTGYIPMNFRPLHDRVLVRRVEAEEKTAGGIIIPDTAQEKPQEGEIVSVGSGTRGEDGTITPLDVKSGDKILFGKWSGTEVKVEGEDLIIMKESDILGIVG